MLTLGSTTAAVSPHLPSLSPARVFITVNTCPRLGRCQAAPATSEPLQRMPTSSLEAAAVTWQWMLRGLCSEHPPLPWEEATAAASTMGSRCCGRVCPLGARHVHTKPSSPPPDGAHGNNRTPFSGLLNPS